MPEQKTKSTKNASNTRAKKSTASRNGSRASSNGAGARSASSATKSRPKRSAPKRGAPKRARPAQASTRDKIAAVASKAKTPLIVGGTAVAGAVAGVVARDRLGAKRSKNPLKRLSAKSIPTPSVDVSKLDLDKVKSAAERVSAYGQRASDVVSAYEKTSKKNK